MTSIVLWGLSLASLTETGSFTYGDDIYINGTGSFNNITTFQLRDITNNGELNLEYLSEFYNLSFTNEYSFTDMAVITSSENYLGITTTLECSTDNSTWETLDVSSSIILSDETPYRSFYGGYVTNTLNTGDYFRNPTEIVNKYFKITTIISYDNVAFDSDVSTYSCLNSNSFTRYGVTLNDYVADYSTAYTNGYKSGYTNGYEVGTTDGYNNGYSTGYQEGHDSVEDLEDYSVQSMLTTILDYPLKLVKEVSNVEIFGVNLYSVITFVLSITLVAFVIKYFI